MATPYVPHPSTNPFTLPSVLSFLLSPFLSVPPPHALQISLIFKLKSFFLFFLGYVQFLTSPSNHSPMPPGMLMEVHKFSKFIHGCAVLLPEEARVLSASILTPKFDLMRKKKCSFLSYLDYLLTCPNYHFMDVSACLPKHCAAIVSRDALLLD